MRCILMPIFNEIFAQYTQLALKSKQYKQNLKNLSIQKNTPVRLATPDVTPIVSLNEPRNNVSISYNEASTNIKDFYDKIEFDARRYNRNFDSQIGVV